MSLFQKAKKSAAKLRLGIMGVSGGGKTYTALQIAKGIGGKVAVIDTENASASKYADEFDFDTLILTNHHPEKYAQAIQAAEAEGYSVIIVDSMSQAWEETKKIAEKFGKEKRNGNTWAGWAEADPQYKKLVNAIIHSKAHVIGTMRAKTETAQEEVNGRKQVVKLGLGAEAGRGIEYEFDIMLEMDLGGEAKVGKSRYNKWTGKTFHKPGPELGAELAKWLSDAPAEAPAPAPIEKALSPGQPEITYGEVFQRLSSALDNSTNGSLDVVAMEIQDAKKKNLITDHELDALRKKFGSKRVAK